MDEWQPSFRQSARQCVGIIEEGTLKEPKVDAWPTDRTIWENFTFVFLCHRRAGTDTVSLKESASSASQNMCFSSARGRITASERGRERESERANKRARIAHEGPWFSGHLSLHPSIQLTKYCCFQLQIEELMMRPLRWRGSSPSRF